MKCVGDRDLLPEEKVGKESPPDVGDPRSS